MSLDITDVVSSYGAYYKEGSKGVKDILAVMRQKSVTEKYFGKTPTKSTRIEKTTISFDRALQAFQKNFTPISTGTFKGRTFDLSHVKIDSKIEPSALEASWLGFLADNDGNDRSKWPIVGWYMAQLLEQAQEDYELNEVYAGAEAAIVVDTASAAGASINGIGTQIATDIAAADIVPVNGPAVNWSTTPATFVTEVETWVNDVKAASNEKKIILTQCDYLFMSEELRDRFAEGMHVKYNTNYAAIYGLNPSVAQMEIPMAFSRLKVVGLPSMSGKKRIFATPRFNRDGYIKRPKSAKSFDVQSVDREVKFLMDFHTGVTYWHPGLMLCSQLV